MIKILEKLQHALQVKKPFVCYRKPNSKEVLSFFQQDDALYFTEDFTESGFVFAPFDDAEKAILMPVSASEFTAVTLDLSNEVIHTQEFQNSIPAKEDHIKLVEKVILEIGQHTFEKVVVSRKEEVEIAEVEVSRIFKNLLLTYSSAMVYVWYHPKVGLWFGATPETLLKSNLNTYETMSLAGTQVYQKGKDVYWKPKELEEQQLVTNFIASQLKEISFNLNINKKETIKAGNLLHLRTKISIEINSDLNALKTLIKALHPTPAVCGLPREATKQFILSHENYDRKFYTGFLGELNLKNKSELFVNLRCMEFINNTASIYVGGGITKDSTPEKEWQETVAKSNIMKQIL